MLGVRDLPAALDGVGLRPGDPVFVRPDFVVEAELLQFVLSPEFRGLERESRRKYAQRRTKPRRSKSGSAKKLSA